MNPDPDPNPNPDREWSKRCAVEAGDLDLLEDGRERGGAIGSDAVFPDSVRMEGAESPREAAASLAQGV